MNNEEIIEKIQELINKPINYTDRANRDMKKAHFTEDILKEILTNPRKIEVHSENNYIIHGKKTAKILIEFTKDNTLLIHWVEYNKVAFIL